MKKIYTLFALIVIILFSVLLNISFSKNTATPMKLKQGVLDLSEWNQKEKGIISLSGEWKFYWGKLLYSKDFKINKPDLIVKIPSVWNTYMLNGKHLSGFGYATYRIHIINAEVGKTMAFRMLPLSTSYKLYIDNKLLKQSGLVGRSQETSRPGYKLDIFEYTPMKDNFDLIIQISNYTYARGGLWFEPQLGTAKNIKEANREIIFRECFFVGCFLLMSIFSIITFLFRIKDKNYLYLTIMCLCIISRIVFNGFSFVQVFQFVNLKTNTIIDYISASWFIAALILLFNDKFIAKNTLWMKKLVWFSTLIYNILIFSLPISVFTRYKFIIQFVFSLIIIIYMIELIIASMKGKKNAFLLLLGFTLFFTFGFYELLIQDNFISSGITDYFNIGCFFLLFFIYILITKNYFDTMKEKEKSLIKIKTLKKKEYEAELGFLKAQIKPHFIHNALNTIISISRYDAEQARNLLVEFSKYLRNCFDFENHNDLVTIESEISFIQSYIMIQKARFGERLQVLYEVNLSNVLIPPLILQPLVENAVVHGVRSKPEGGTIIVYGHQIDSYICIGVKDDGIGFSEDKINEVLTGIRTSRGVGLYNINQRLKKLYHTELKIENMEEGGVNISMTIPLRNV